MKNKETKTRIISVTWIRLLEHIWSSAFGICLSLTVHWMVDSIVSTSEVHIIVKLESLITDLEITKIGRSPMAWVSFIISQKYRYVKLVNSFRDSMEMNWTKKWYGKLWVFCFNVFFSIRCYLLATCTIFSTYATVFHCLVTRTDTLYFSYFCKHYISDHVCDVSLIFAFML